MLEGFAWVVTNLPYCDLGELATHLIGLGVRDRCTVALLVRAEWIVPKARRRLVRKHPHFAGAVMLTATPCWVERAQGASPRHNLAWGVGRDAALGRSLAQVCRAGGSRPIAPRAGLAGGVIGGEGVQMPTALASILASGQAGLVAKGAKLTFSRGIINARIEPSQQKPRSFRSGAMEVN